MQGGKRIIKFEGDHNSPRPQSYYDSVSTFFYKTLRPPLLPSARSNKRLMGAYKVGNITNESFFSKIVDGLQSANTATCSSSTDAPNILNGVVQLLELLPCNVIVSGCILTASPEIVPAKTPAVELLSESLNQLSVTKETDLVGFLMFSLCLI
jgi:hypothetical protein